MTLSITTQPVLSALMAGVRTMQSQQQVLAGQASSGLVSDDIGGLGGSAATVLRLQPQMSVLQAYSGTITQSQTWLNVSQSALSQVSAIASSLYSSVANLQSSSTPADLQQAVASAQAGLAAMGSLLNTQSAGRYVFSGVAEDTPVISDVSGLSGGAFATSVGAAISDNADDADAAMAAILASANSDIPFSSVLTTNSAAALQSSTLIGPGTRLATGYVVTGAQVPGAMSNATSSAMSTGSPIRDLLAGLTAVANMSTAQLSAAQSSGLLSKLGTMVSGASDGIADVIGNLGTQQQSLTSQSTQLSAMSAVLTAQYGTMTDADLATVSAEQASLTTQLTASYSLIADLKGMSLAAYL